MLENWKISVHQFKILVILCYVGSSILLAPRNAATAAKQDVWIAAILGLIIAVLLVYLYSAVGNLFPNMSLIKCTEELLGKWIGIVVSLLFIFYLFFNSSILVYMIGDFVTTQIMPETPIQFTNLLFVIIVVFGTRLGLEAFSRTAEILYHWIIGLLIIFLVFLFPTLEFKNIQPIFEHGAKPVIRGALSYTSFSSLTLIPLMMIFPACVNNQREAKKAFIKGAFIAGIIMFIVTTFCILVLGHDITARNAFPSYALAKKISLGNFIERIEVIIAVIWVITMFYKIILHFYGAVIGIAQILKLKDYRPLTLPLGMILVVFSLIIFPNSTYAIEWGSTTWLPYVSTYGFFLPLFLLIVSYLRDKHKEK